MLRILPSKSGPPEGAVQKYVESTFGPIQEVIRVDNDLEILVATDVTNGCLRLVTQGMSRQSVSTDNAQELYTELMLTLVPGTATDWPIAVLTALAHYPFQNNTFLYAGHTVENQAFPECPYPYFLLGPSVTAPQSFSRITLGTTPTLFLSVYPVYHEEAQLRKSQGTTALQKRFERFQITDLVQDARLNSCHPIVDQCEQSVEAARTALRHKNSALASQHLIDAGQGFEELSLQEHALVMYLLAGDPGGRAAERLKALGSRLDKACLESNQRRMLGLDFPPLAPKQMQFGLRIVKKIDSKTRKLFNILLSTPPDRWATRLGDYPDGVLEQFMQQVKLHAELWVDLACAASLWYFLDATRDHDDHAESAYRAVLSQGDERSDLFMDLEATPGQLKGVEDVIAANDPATRPAARASLYLWSRLDPKTTWQALSQKPEVAVTTGFVKTAAQLVGPKILEGLH
ncbi:suppressor of fused domain protein [bacterium]|nr:suppressor of fused domain protein [bacterium]